MLLQGNSNSAYQQFKSDNTIDPVNFSSDTMFVFDCCMVLSCLKIILIIRLNEVDLILEGEFKNHGFIWKFNLERQSDIN